MENPMTRILLAALALSALAGPALADDAAPPASPPALRHTAQVAAAEQQAALTDETRGPGGSEAEPHATGEATRALNLLEAMYPSFTDFRRQGDAYAATVTDRGNRFEVRIDPATGRVEAAG
jgi:hypothetical protein